MLNSSLENWLASRSLTPVGLEQLAGDVSRRRYFRVALADQTTLIAVHYPPDMTAVCSRFLATSDLLTAADVRVPRVISSDCTAGYMLLEDLGRETLYDRRDLGWDQLASWLDRALGLAARVAGLCRKKVESLNPPLDGALLEQELDISWRRLLGRARICGSADLRRRLERALDQLLAHLAEARLVPCHRDFMARNLLLTPDDELGVIDHQDLRLGPRWYDLASLLNDSLFPPPTLERRLRLRAFEDESDLDLYRRCAVQRCLKAAGTFVGFARQGDNRHLELVIPTLCRAARHLSRLPEGNGVGETLAAAWRQLSATDISMLD